MTIELLNDYVQLGVVAYVFDNLADAKMFKNRKMDLARLIGQKGLNDRMIAKYPSDANIKKAEEIDAKIDKLQSFVPTRYILDAEPPKPRKRSDNADVRAEKPIKRKRSYGVETPKQRKMSDGAETPKQRKMSDGAEDGADNAENVENPKKRKMTDGAEDAENADKAEKPKKRKMSDGAVNADAAVKPKKRKMSDGKKTKKIRKIRKTKKIRKHIKTRTKTRTRTLKISKQIST